MDINSYFWVTQMMQIYICDLFFQYSTKKLQGCCGFCSMKMDWAINPCWTGMGLFTGYFPVRSTETLLKSPPGLMFPGMWNAGYRSPALRPSLQRWVWHGQKAGMEILDSSATTGNLGLQISTPGLKLWHFVLSIRNLLSRSKPQATRDQMDVWSRVFTVLTHFFIDVYLQKNIVWEHRNLYQFWTEYSSYHAEFCAIFLPICLNLISRLWTSIMWFFCILLDFLRGLFVMSLVLTQSVP